MSRIKFKWPIGLGRYARHALGIISGETYREPQTMMKRTSVQVKPCASLCTATYEAVSNRGGVEPLLSWEYVHGNQEG